VNPPTIKIDSFLGLLKHRQLLIPSGKHTKNYGKPPFLMGKLTISIAIFNSYVNLPEGMWDYDLNCLLFSNLKPVDRLDYHSVFEV
jgi:hypothetical protein